MQTRSTVVGIGIAVAALAGVLGTAQLQAAADTRTADALTPVEAQARQVAIETGALPTSLGQAPSYCPTEDIAITYQPIPPGSFQVGAYVEPLLPPGADPRLVTGIAYCTSSPLSVMGFDAVNTGEGW